MLSNLILCKGQLRPKKVRNSQMFVIQLSTFNFLSEEYVIKYLTAFFNKDDNIHSFKFLKINDIKTDCPKKQIFKLIVL